MTFLRTLFGPGQAEIWRQLSEQIGGSSVARRFMHPATVVARVKDWTVTLDTYTVSSGDSSNTFARLRRDCR